MVFVYHAGRNYDSSVQLMQLYAHASETIEMTLSNMRL